MTPQSKWGMWRQFVRLGWLSLGLAGGCCWNNECCHSEHGYKSGGLKDPGRDPAPNGAAVEAWWQEQAARAEASDFTIYLTEWFCGSNDLGPYGLHKLGDIIRRLPEVPFPIVIEPHLDQVVNEQRRLHIVKALEQQGIADADIRVTIAYPQAEGMYGQEATFVFADMFLNRGSGGYGGGGGRRSTGGFNQTGLGMGGFGGYGGGGGGGYGGGGYGGYGGGYGGGGYGGGGYGGYGGGGRPPGGNY